MAKATDKRKGWLAKLLVGDRVGVQDGRAGMERRTYRIATVERISPSGRIFTTKGFEFHPDGNGVGSDTWHSVKAIEPTPEFRSMVARQNLENWVAKYFRSLDPDKVKAASNESLTTLLEAVKPFLPEKKP